MPLKIPPETAKKLSYKQLLYIRRVFKVLVYILIYKPLKNYHKYVKNLDSRHHTFSIFRHISNFWDSDKVIPLSIKGEGK